jgi:hypothetical protein
MGPLAWSKRSRPFPLTTMAAIATGQTVIAAEVGYSYRPLLGVVFREALDLNRSALFMPRFGGNITLN